MNRKSILWYLIEFMVAIIFYTLFFAIAGPDAPASAWLACIFFTMALVATVATPFIFKKCKIRHFLGIPVGYVSIGYFAVEFLIGFVFVLMRQKNPAASITLQLIIFVLYCIVVLSLLLVNEYKYPSPVTPKNGQSKHSKAKDVLVLPEPEEAPAADKKDEDKEETEEFTDDSEVEIVEEIEEKPAHIDNGFVEKASRSLKALLEKCSDEHTCEEIEKAYDSIRSSFKYSVEDAKIQEMSIINKISLLTKEVESSDFESACETVSEIKTVLEKRNKIIRG